VFTPPDVPPRRWLSEVAVVKAGNEYFLWYSVDAHQLGDATRQEWATLRLARSPDGLAWQHVGIVHTANDKATRYIRHAVHHDGELFHLWYVDRNVGEDRTGLQHLTSRDGAAWTEAGSDSLDALAAAYTKLWVGPHPAGRFRALVAEGRDNVSLRWFRSADGTSWTADFAENGPTSIGERREVADGVVLESATGLWLWMTTSPADAISREQIMVAFRKGPAR
jgi:hypothetical protein